jgi:[ribosomal protein S18]-alanine N-acetyltransferase
MHYRGGLWLRRTGLRRGARIWKRHGNFTRCAMGHSPARNTYPPGRQRLLRPRRRRLDSRAAYGARAMNGDLMPALRLVRYDRPDVRAEALAMSIMQDAFDPAYGEAWTAGQLSGFVSLPHVTLTLAQLDGASLGFSLVRSVVDEAELLLLAVGKQWRGRGVGKALLSDCLAVARLAGMKSLHLEVRENNPAVNLYSGMGFENVHFRPRYYRGKDGTAYDALSYRFDL